MSLRWLEFAVSKLTLGVARMGCGPERRASSFFATSSSSPSPGSNLRSFVCRTTKRPPRTMMLAIHANSSASRMVRRWRCCSCTPSSRVPLGVQVEGVERLRERTIGEPMIGGSPEGAKHRYRQFVGALGLLRPPSNPAHSPLQADVPRSGRSRGGRTRGQIGDVVKPIRLRMDSSDLKSHRIPFPYDGRSVFGFYSSWFTHAQSSARAQEVV